MGIGHMAKQHKITLAPESSGAIFEAGLFGINAEVTRRGFHGGLSAQMLGNRKLFMGETGVDGWVCERFDRILDRPEESLCRSNFVILRSGSMSHASSLMTLQAGKDYEAAVWVKAVSPTAEVTFGAAGLERTFSVTADGAPYHALRFTFTAPTDGERTFVISASGDVAVYEASLLPTDHYYGMRPDVIECLRQIAPPSIRYPGGCYADHFEWQESMKPVECRKPVDGRSKSFMLRNNYHQDCVEVGINEFVMLCRALNAEPEFTVSHLIPDGEDARRLVEYCNGGADTEYGGIRQSLGYDAFGIKLWYIGNESYYSGGPYRLDGGLAGERTDELVNAMRLADPTIAVVLCLAGDDWLRPWSRAFMERLTCTYEYVSYHWYFGTGPTAEPHGPTACEKMKQTYLHDVCDDLEFYKNDLLADVWPSVKVCVDEWNFCWGSGSNNALLMSNALQLHFFARNGEKYHIREGRFFMPVNEGMITVTPTESILESSGHLFRLMRGHLGGRIIPCTADTETLDLLCTDHDGKRFLSVINRGDEPCALEPEGYRVAAATEIRADALRFESNVYEVLETDGRAVSGNSVLFLELVEG